MLLLEAGRLGPDRAVDDEGPDGSQEGDAAMTAAAFRGRAKE